MKHSYYNVKKMVENGYLVQERSIHDRRFLRVRLSEKGLLLRERISEMFERHSVELSNGDLDNDALNELNHSLLKLERFWTGRLGYPGVTSAA